MQRIVVAEWGREERRAVRDALICGGARAAAAVQELTRGLETDFGQRPVLLLGRGRSAIEVALRCFMDQRPGRTEVVFPGYICPSVIEAIERCGLLAVPADIGADLNLDPADVEPRLSSRTLAVIAAHMYGCPARMPELEEICARQGIFLIDDAAQVAGVSLDGRPLGAFGACGILSFSQSKTLVAGIGNAGGALIVSDRRIEPAARRIWAAAGSERYGIGNLFRFLTEAVYQEEAKPYRHYARTLAARTGWRSRSAPHEAMRMAGGSALIAIAQRDSLSRRVLGRRRVADLFAGHLAGSGVGFPQYEPGRYLARIIIALPPDAGIDAVRRRLRAEGVYTRLPYPISRYRADLVRAPAMQPRLLELPSHSRMREDEIARICATVTSAAGCAETMT